MSRSFGAMHVLVLPLAAQGHINPMLCFSKQLAARGFIITFLITHEAHKRMLETATHPSESLRDMPSRSLDIRFAVMPDGPQELLLGPRAGFDPVGSLMSIMKGMESQQGVIEEMVVRSRATPQPIVCIISDAFCPWTCPIATKLGIQRVIFSTSNGTRLATIMELKRCELKSADVSNGDEMVAGVPIARSEILSTLPIHNPDSVKLLIKTMNGLQDATCMVVNTCEELEGFSLKAVASSEAKVYYIGPLIPLDNHNTTLSVNFYKEQGSCMAWLDRQAPSSVLYVSFGSIASLAPQELEELAYGIEESERPFLWVSRNSNHLFPDGFLDRTRGQGLVVEWVPQIQVLGHIAVGGFLSHCGWNSILESIHMGVPILCYPILFDQYHNALLITRVWKLGISLSKEGGNGLITREVIQEGVSSILSSKELHLNSSTWRGMSQRTLQQGGSSYLALERFIDTLKSCTS